MKGWLDGEMGVHWERNGWRDVWSFGMGGGMNGGMAGWLDEGMVRKMGG